MADTFTTNLNLTKPEVGASSDTWGDKLNADLDTIDGYFQAAIKSFMTLTWAADRIAYATSGTAMAVTPLTAFARTILDDADAAAVRTTLGLSPVATDSIVPVARGGTGASDPTAARLNLNAQQNLGYTPLDVAGSNSMSAAFSVITTAATARTTYQNTAGTCHVGQASTAQMDVYTDTNEPIVFGVNGAEVARFNTSAQMTIGPSGTPATGRFNVGGGRSFFAPNGEHEAIGFAHNVTRLAAGQAHYIGASNEATPSLVFTNVGGVETARLTTSGNFTITGTGTGVNWIGTSDERLKLEITSIPVDGALVDGIDWVEWLWRETLAKDCGVTAQGLQRSGLGAFVHVGGDGHLGVNYPKLALAAALSVAARVRALEAKL